MNEYLTDAELLALIDTAEEQGLLSAPRELKGAVLAQAQRPPRLSRSRRKQYAGYCLRVALATAASLVILFGSAPVAERVAQLPEPEMSVSQHFVQFTDRLGEGFAQMSQAMSQLFLD